MRKSAPIKTTLKAGKRVGKALSKFEKAADQLEIASAQHLAAADQLDKEVAARYDAAVLKLDAEYDTIVAAFRAEMSTLETLAELADENDTAAYNAQIQSDNLRALLAVA
jgi:hypothetical protein